MVSQVESSGSVIVGSEERQGSVADVEVEEPAEEPWVALKDVEDAAAETGGAIHQEQAAGHEAGQTLDAAVGLLIAGEVVWL